MLMETFHRLTRQDKYVWDVRIQGPHAAIYIDFMLHSDVRART